jgi:hypothetical protein
MVRAQKIQLLAGLHALGNDLELEVVRAADDRECNRRVIGVGGEVLNERSVDFDGVDRKSLQVGKARLTRSEVVDGEANSQRTRAPTQAKFRDELNLFTSIPDLEFELPTLEAHHHPPELLPGNLPSVDHEHR